MVFLQNLLMQNVLQPRIKKESILSYIFTTKFLFPSLFRYPVCYLVNFLMSYELATVIEKLQSLIYFFRFLLAISTIY